MDSSYLSNLQEEARMLSSEGSEILRVAILSGVIGFAGFCVSYGFYVWRKRNSTNRRSKSRARTLAQVCAFLGCATIALSWASNFPSEGKEGSYREQGFPIRLSAPPGAGPFAI